MKSFFVTKLLLVVILSFTIATAHAMDKDRFRQLVDETVAEVIDGEVSDIKPLVAKMEELIRIGQAGAKDYAASHPADAKFLDFVIDNTPGMLTMGLEEIEEQWHDMAILETNGLDPHSYDHFSPVISLMDSILHPATALLALKAYEAEKDSDLLIQVKDELSEVVEHLDAIK